MTSEAVCERTLIQTGRAVRLLPAGWFARALEPWGACSCVVEIDWPERLIRTMTIIGADSLQSLYLALQTIAAELFNADRPVFLRGPDDILHLPTSEVVADLEAARTKGRP